MKKTKLLLTLSSCITVGACGMTPLMTSCASNVSTGEMIPTAEIKDITAVCKKQYLTLNESVNKEDFLVTITKKDGSLVNVDNWACLQGFPYKLEDMKSHTLNFKYGDTGVDVKLQAVKKMYVSTAEHPHEFDTIEKATDILDIKVIRDNQKVLLNEGEFTITPSFPYKFESQDPVTFVITVGNMKLEYTVTPDPQEVGKKFRIFAPQEFKEDMYQILLDNPGSTSETIGGVESEVVTPEGDYYEALDKALELNTSVDDDNKIDMFITKGYFVDSYKESKYTRPIAEEDTKTLDFVKNFSFTQPLMRGTTSDGASIKALAYNLDPIVYLYDEKWLEMVLGDAYDDDTILNWSRLERYYQYSMRLGDKNDPMTVGSIDGILYTNMSNPTRANAWLDSVKREDESLKTYSIPKIKAETIKKIKKIYDLYGYQYAEQVTRLPKNYVLSEQWIKDFITNRVEWGKWTGDRTATADCMPFTYTKYFKNLELDSWAAVSVKDKFGFTAASGNENHIFVPVGSNNLEAAEFALTKILAPADLPYLYGMYFDLDEYYETLSKYPHILINSKYVFNNQDEPEPEVIKYFGFDNIKSDIMDMENNLNTSSINPYIVKSDYDYGLDYLYVTNFIPYFYNGKTAEGILAPTKSYENCLESFINEVKTVYPELEYTE